MNHLREEATAERLGTKALDEAEAARKATFDEDQRRLQERFPATFADDLPPHPSSKWEPNQ
jgi:hypothetical protein